MIKNALLYSFLGLVLISCKHNHEPSQFLKDAFAVQNQGLDDLEEIKGQIAQLPDELKTSFEKKRAYWVSQMIEINEFGHDHSNCSHGHKKTEVSIPDSLMLVVQTEWRDSLLALKTDMQTALTAPDTSQ